jgi:hypothetical protein
VKIRAIKKNDPPTSSEGNGRRPIDPDPNAEYGRVERALKKVLSAPKIHVDEALERERRERRAKRS